MVERGDYMEEKSNISFIESCDVPSAYSNRQSFYEVLCYINYKLNELIDVYNSVELDYKTYVDGQLDTVKAYADSVAQDAQENSENYTNTKTSVSLDSAKKYTDDTKENLLEKITKNINDIKKLTEALTETNQNLVNESLTRSNADNSLDARITEVSLDNDTAINTLRRLIISSNAVYSAKLEEKSLELKEYIQKHYLETTTVMNPWRGKDTNYQSVIDDIYRVYRPLSMTVNEIESVLPEITSIDEYETLTVGDFDFNGLRVKQYLSDAYVFSVITGKYITIQDAYYELIRLLGDTPSDPLSKESTDYVTPNSKNNMLSNIDSKISTTPISVDQMDAQFAIVPCVAASLSLYYAIASPT